MLLPAGSWVSLWLSVMFVSCGSLSHVNSTTDTIELKENGKEAADMIYKREGESVTFECILNTTEWSLTGIDTIYIEKWQDYTVGFKNINYLKRIQAPFLQTGRYSVELYDVTVSDDYSLFTGNVKITISALKVGDSGMYRCALVRFERNVPTVRLSSSEVNFNVSKLMV